MGEMMYPPTHFIVAFFLAEIFVHLGVLDHTHALITAILAVLIDLDHYIIYAIRHKDLNFMHFWNDSNTGKEKGGRTILHFLPGMLAVYALAVLLFFINKTACLIVILAYYSHILLDNCYSSEYDRNRWRFKSAGIDFNINKTEFFIDIAVFFCTILLVMI